MIYLCTGNLKAYFLLLKQVNKSSNLHIIRGYG